jgi:Superinfection immunity protein
MRRWGIRASAWALAAAVIALLSAACSSAAPPRAASDLPSNQQIFTMQLLKDDRALDRGVLSYSDVTTMPVRQTTTFYVHVTDVGKGQQTTAFVRESNGLLMARQDVPTGGIVSVQGTCSGNLACTPQPFSARRLIPATGRSASWQWQVTANSPGDARMLLIATTYAANSDIPLNQTAVPVDIKVRPTAVYRMEHAVDTAKAAILSTSSAVVVVAGALGAVLALRRKKRPAGATAAPAPEPAPAVMAAGRTGPADAHTSPAAVPAGPPAVNTGPLPSAVDPPAAQTGPLPSAVDPPAAQTGPLPSADGPPAAQTGLPPPASGVPSVAPVIPPRARAARGRKALLWISFAAGVLIILILAWAAVAKSPAVAIALAVIIFVVLPVYLLPAFIAYRRHAPDPASVAVINVFLGWTFIGWVAALALSVRERRPTPAMAGAPGPELLRYAPGPGRRPLAAPVNGTGMTLTIWQTADQSLTCQDPGDSWASRWTYQVSLGETSGPQFALTREEHRRLSESGS